MSLAAAAAGRWAIAEMMVVDAAAGSWCAEGVARRG